MKTSWVILLTALGTVTFLFLIFLIVFGFHLFEKTPLEVALDKVDPVTGKNAIEMFESADFEAGERMNLTPEEIKLIFEAGLVNQTKLQESLDKSLQSSIDAGSAQIENSLKEQGL